MKLKQGIMYYSGQKRRHLLFCFLCAAMCCLPGLVFTGCGNNGFSDAESPPAEEEAAKALEEKNPEKAVSLLLSDLGDGVRGIYDAMGSMTPAAISDAVSREISALRQEGVANIPIKVSVLASAHAQKFGIDPLDIALALATGEQNSGNTITLLYPVLPDASAANKAGLSEAIAILNAIDPADLSKADFFKKSLYLMASISLITKTYDTDPADGVITLNELTDLGSATTGEILNLLEIAIGALGYTEQSGNLAEAATKIEAVRTEILNQSGGDDTEKLKEFLSAASS